MTALPKTRLGAWGLYLLLAFATLFLLAAVGRIIFMPAVLIFAIGLVGIVLNSIAIIKKDFSWMGTLVGGLIGAFVIFWVASELLLPH
jgi:hypothetical protein